MSPDALRGLGDESGPIAWASATSPEASIGPAVSDSVEG